MTTELLIAISGIAALILLLIVCNIRIVPQSKAWVMERIGVYSKTWHTGLHIKIPFIERAAKKVDLREQILVCGEGFNHGHYHNHKNGSVFYNGNYSKAGDAYGDLRGLAQNDERKNNMAADVAARASAKLPTGVTPVNVAASMNTLGEHAAKKLLSSGQVGLYVESSEARNANGIVGRVSHNNVHSRSSQPVITKDNVSMEIDTVVFYQVTDPKLYAYGHAAPLKAIEQLVATSLRNIVGGLELDETLTSRDIINAKMRTILDEATDPWGIKITRVELRNIIISDVELAEAMEKQMIAERTKRAKILIAEGESQSKILEAEGQRKYEILLAEGKAEAIRLVNEAKPTQEFLTIRALEAYEAAANGNATKIIVPSEIQSLAGLALSGSEIFKEGEKMEAPHVDVVD